MSWQNYMKCSKNSYRNSKLKEEGRITVIVEITARDMENGNRRKERRQKEEREPEGGRKGREGTKERMTEKKIKIEI